MAIGFQCTQTTSCRQKNSYLSSESKNLWLKFSVFGVWWCIFFFFKGIPLKKLSLMVSVCQVL